ncbi:GrpB family protein [Oryzifoliimicrobium ureilyticus]|uniref:GrpB family protein n=1 Tax=Oryzifoliimicrobium ureilyticus TaxID=3113724 RepID=UPI00307624FA
MAKRESVVLCEWSPDWHPAFTEKARQLRRHLGSLALRIDHIGSTAVKGLAAKPIIDIQISVADFEPIANIAEPLRQAGYLWRADNTELTKRYFREMPGAERTHIHVRIAGSWHEQRALLFRDYLRNHAAACHQYEAVKRQLAASFRDDRLAYTEGKSEVIWSILQRADRWAAETGWQAGETD